MSEAGEEIRAAEAKAIATSRELRRRRARALGIGFAVWVALPTAIAAVYYGLIATPQYESIAILTVESSESAAPTAERPESFLPHQASSRDVQLAREYIRSRAMLEVLARDHGVVEHYQDPAADRWSRLAAGASREEVYDYFQEKVQVSGDSSAGTLTLRVRAFSSAKATEIGKAVIATAEAMMNEVSGRAQRDQLERGAIEAKEAQARLARALAAVAAAGPKVDEALTVEKDLARHSLEAALANLEASRVQSARQRRYLIAIAEPSVADQATYPRRLWNVLTVFITAVALAGVLSLLIAAIREHAKF
jgi:capsular polysaccharide transport system permease protein